MLEENTSIYKYLHNTSYINILKSETNFYLWHEIQKENPKRKRSINSNMIYFKILMKKHKQGLITN